MSSENKTIHDFDFKLICDYYLNVERQGPGSPEVTLKALNFTDKLTDKSVIADLGCGTGGQTMTLAQHTEGQITGLDISPDFINRFNQNAKQLGFSGRVKGIVGSMDNLPFEKKSLDLIWSEGAMYNIGFERGLKEWGEYLKAGGFIVASEATLFTAKRPAEIQAFCNLHLPDIDTIPNKTAVMQKAGYIPVATFIIPESCWTEHFYTPCIKTHEAFLKKHVGNKMAEELVASEIHEMEIYRKYKEFYGYAFYIGKKI